VTQLPVPTLETCKIRMTLAINMAKRSSCRQLKVGAVITCKNGEYHACAFNRPPEGREYCNKNNCPPGDIDGYCKRVEHAESIAIDNFYAKHKNISAGICFTNWFPCHHCFLELYRKNIRIFIYAYDDLNCPTSESECGKNTQLIHLYHRRHEYKEELSAVKSLTKEYGNVILAKYKNDLLVRE